MRLILWTLFICVFCSACQETEIKSRTVGYKGKAKLNPFLAAERLLTKEGFEVFSEHGVGRLDYETTTLFIPTSSLNTVGRTKRLLEWVASGGHLVLMLEGGEMGGNDFVITPRKYHWQDEPTEGVQYLLDEVGVSYELKEEESPTMTTEVDDDTTEAEDDTTEADHDRTEVELDEWESMEEKDRVLLGSEESAINLGSGELVIHHWSDILLEYTVWDEGDYGSGDSAEHRHHYLSLSHEYGRVSLLSDARLLRNRNLAYSDHAEFLVTLVELSNSGRTVFSSGDGDSFFAMLWRHFKMGVIGLLVVVVFWLWRHLPRYGPAEDIGDGNTREFTEQLRGVGRFLWRHKRDDSLLNSLRGHVNRALSLQPSGSDEGVFEQIAEKTGMPVASVSEAMTREQITEPAVMVRVTQNLQKILKHIN